MDMVDMDMVDMDMQMSSEESEDGQSLPARWLLKKKKKVAVRERSLPTIARKRIFRRPPSSHLQYGTHCKPDWLQ